MLERLPEFVGNHPIMTLIFLGLVAAFVYTEIARKFRGFKAVRPAELVQLINRSDAVVIDVGATGDFEKGHIVDALHIPPSQVDPQAKPLVGREEQQIVLYCKTGLGSEQIAKRLVKAGFKNVSWLSGGLTAWINDEFPVTKGRA